MKEIKELIAKNRLEEASQKLRNVTLNQELESEIILLTSRLYELIDKGRIGLISSDNASAERNKIILSFLSLINKIDKENILIRAETIKLPVNIGRYQIDDRIRTSLERIHEKQLELNQKHLPTNYLIDEFYNLFDRMTFIREPKIETC